MNTHAMRQEIRVNGATVLDEAYDYTHSSIHVLDPPLSLVQGDQLLVTCTYLNDTGLPLPYGNGLHAETCNAALYVVPAVSGMAMTMFDCLSN